MIPFQHGRSITVNRRTASGVDDRGNATYTTTTASIHGCGIYPRNLGDVTGDGRDGVTIGLTVLAPADSDVLITDQIVVDGLTYRLVGAPSNWTHPMTGWRPGMQLDLERVEG